MHHLSLNIRKIMEEANVPPEQRNAYLSFVIAQSLAQTLEIPSAPVESAEGFFAERFRAQVTKLLNNFNEHFVIDIDQCVKLTEQVYCLRYAFVHRPNTREARTLLCYLLAHPNDSVAPILTAIQMANIEKEFLATFADLMLSFTAEWKAGSTPV